jgi:hypothetical protein
VPISAVKLIAWGLNIFYFISDFFVCIGEPQQFFSCILQAEAAEEAPVAKMAYKVRLTKFDESKKVALIKQIKSMIEGMNLVQVRNCRLIICIFTNSIIFFPRPRNLWNLRQRM